MAQADPSAPVKTKDEETAIAEMPDDIHDDDEPTTEELIERLRQSLRDVEAGRIRPAREVIGEIRARRAADANAGK